MHGYYKKGASSSLGRNIDALVEQFNKASVGDLGANSDNIALKPNGKPKSNKFSLELDDKIRSK